MRCSPLFTGVTRHMNVRVRPGANGPKAQVFTYAV